MSRLPINKLYIDSQFRTEDSVSDSQFKIQLPFSIDLPEFTFFQIDDINIPHTWMAVEKDINDHIYIDLYDYTSAPSTTPAPVECQIIVPPGNYTGQALALAIQGQLVNAFATSTPSTRKDLRTVLGVVYTSATNSISIQPLNLVGFTWKLKVLTDKDLRTVGHSFYNVAGTNIPSMNDVFRNYGSSPIYDITNYYTSAFLNLTLCNDVYLSSPNLGTFTTLTVTGEQSVIKRIPVTTDYGFMVLDTVTSVNDLLECSRVTLTSLEFHLKDAKGRYIPLHGANISFTIIFSQSIK
jgi:hypothetical protein